MKQRPPATPRAGRYTVDAAAKALELLNAFSFKERSFSLSDLAGRTGIPRATTFRLLSTLEHYGFISKAGNEYHLGIKCLVLGNVVAGDLDVREKAHPHLVELRDVTRETTHVAVLHQWQVVYLERVPSPGTLSVPHGIGYAWATMLWEVYWNLIDKHGFNQNVYDPWFTGGNNLAIQLVMDGMKLQPCSPGFVTGRNAILQADDLLTGGANSCSIWKGFAKRGLGFSASQGSSNSVNDGVQAFDLPPACRAAISVEPGEIFERVRVGKSIGAGMRVWNNTAADGADLNWTMYEAATDCSVPADVPWLSISPASGATAAQSFSKPQAVLNASGLAPGNYTALVCFTSDGGSAQIPVTMNVKK